MKKNFKAGKFIVVTTSESPSISNSEITIYPIDSLVQDLVNDAVYERGHELRREFTKTYLDNKAFKYFRRSQHAMLLPKQLDYLKSELTDSPLKTSSAVIDRQMKALKNLHNVLPISKYTFHTIRTSLKRSLAAGELNKDEEIDQWIEVLTLSAGDQFMKIDGEQALSDFEQEFPDRRITKSILLEMIRRKAKELLIQPDGYSDEQLDYLNELIEQQKNNQRIESPTPIDYKVAFDKLNSISGKKLKKVWQVRRYITHHADSGSPHPRPSQDRIR